MNRGEALPIVLCCAEETEVSLVAVVDALHQDGFTPEVLPGVETDAELLTAAADRIRGPALFVLCQSDDLDRFQVRRLQGLFSARKGPEHRMITVDVQAMGAMALLPEVRVAAQEGRRVAPPPEEDDGRYMRDVIVTSAVSAPGASIPQRQRRHHPVAQEPQGISDEALGMTSDTSGEISAPRRLFPEPDVLIATDPTGETLTPFDGMHFDVDGLSGVPHPVGEEYAPPDEPDSDLGGEPPRRIGWGEPSAPIAVDRVKSGAHRADTRADADAAPLPSVSSPIQVDDPDAPADEPEPERRAGRIGLLLLAGAGMAGVVAMAVLHGTAPAGPGPGESTQRGVPVARGQTSAGKADAGPETKVEMPDAETSADAGAMVPAVASTGPATGGGESGAAGSEDSTAGTGSDGESGGTTGGDPAASGGTTGGDGTSGDGTSGDAQTTTGAEPVPAPSTGGGVGTPPPPGPKSVPPPPNVDPSADQLDATIDAAVAAGRLEYFEQDDLLISRSGKSTMTWDEAAAKCRKRKVEGIRRWRLPSKGQLSRMRKAKLLTAGSYWSRSEVGGDEVYAIDAASGRLNVWLKMEPNARALCVRKRP